METKMTLVRLALVASILFPQTASAAPIVTGGAKGVNLAPTAVQLPTFGATSLPGASDALSLSETGKVSTLLPSAAVLPVSVDLAQPQAKPAEAVAAVARSAEVSVAARSAGKSVTARSAGVSDTATGEIAASRSSEKVSAKDGLSTTVAQIKKAEGSTAKASLLDRFFSFSRTRKTAKTSAVPTARAMATTVGREAASARLTAPGSRLLPAAAAEKSDKSEKKDATPAPSKSAVDGDEDGFTPEQKKGIMGMFFARPFGMLAFSLSAMAYPLMLIDVIGKSGMYEMFSLGGMLSIGLNLIVGKLGDHLPLKKYIIFNNLLRAVLSLANAVLYAAGMLDFTSLLILTIINGWQFASLFITDQAMTAELVGANRGKIRSTESLIRTASILMNIFSGVFLGAFIVDSMGFVWTFAIVAGINLIPVYILWKMLPNIAYKEGKMPLGEYLKTSFAKFINWVKSIGQTTDAEMTEEQITSRKKTLWTYGTNIAMLGAGFAGYFFVYQTPFWMIAAIGTMLIRSEIFKGTIMKHGLLKMALGLVLVTAFVEVPMRNAVLGAMSEEMVGELGKAAFYGKLIASFYMGQLITSTGLLSEKLDMTLKKIGKWKLKNPKVFNLKSTMRWVGALVLAAWASYFLLPAGFLMPLVPLAASLGIKGTLAAWLGGWIAGSSIAFAGYNLENGEQTPRKQFFSTALKWLGYGTIAASFGVAALPMLSPLALNILGYAVAVPFMIKAYHMIHDFAPKVSERGWLRLEAVALLGMSAPLLLWGNHAVLFASLFLFGLLHNPTNRTISSTYSEQAKAHADGNYQFLSGIKGSFVTMATSTAYALYGLAKTIPEMLWGDPNAFPFTWYVVGALYAAFAVVFLIASKVMPFGEKADKKKAG